MRLPGFAEYAAQHPKTIKNYSGQKARALSWKVVGPFLWAAARSLPGSCAFHPELEEQEMQEAWSNLSVIYRNRKDRPDVWAAIQHNLAVFRTLFAQEAAEEKVPPARAKRTRHA